MLKDLNLISSVNKRAKRLSLRVDQKAGFIKLTIPPYTTKWSINRFLKVQEAWIKEKQAGLLSKILIFDGATILFKGNKCSIKIVKHTKRTTDISLKDNVITIKTSRDDPTTNLKRWFITQAMQDIEPLSHAKSLLIKKNISKIDLRDPSSRWGSCSTDKRLMFSWRLIMAPSFVLEYVVAHEVAHLKHMDHSNRFWNTCYLLTNGDADKARQWLRDNGNKLMRYF